MAKLGPGEWRGRLESCAWRRRLVLNAILSGQSEARGPLAVRRFAQLGPADDGHWPEHVDDGPKDKRPARQLSTKGNRWVGPYAFVLAKPRQMASLCGQRRMGLSTRLDGVVVGWPGMANREDKAGCAIINGRTGNRDATSAAAAMPRGWYLHQSDDDTGSRGRAPPE
ncbi:hypothetical protein GGTG_03352 [Gaeumannomyces tritici R3-111a-1]|uniref:Uncharacterized protein n=1 Tax=Gaeumannomyces tritici (strain R3-111a-1) TaxID=644352 RepID=J3NPZ4_GAET3|nr:hypothetical protein GGTG_03352 [Gaeumannomyces tritici R3-111a-1]EJT78250.1 hypothetical protein GGTG_03352 [Gaeumannomyces tritici R3-111a-1]